MKSKSITFRIDHETLLKLKKLAKDNHLPYQTFLKVMIHKTLDLNNSKKLI